ncbi:hypothetical protein C9150_23780, partial [Escherichia coli]
MSNPTSNSGKFMDKKLQALVKLPHPSSPPPSPPLLSSFSSSLLLLIANYLNFLYTHNTLYYIYSHSPTQLYH